MMGNLTPFVVNGPPVTNTNTINFTGGPWTFIRTHVDSSTETLATWRLDEDTSAYISVKNIDSTNAALQPTLYGFATSTRPGLWVMGEGTTDSGSFPLMIFNMRVNSTTIASRPMAAWRNNNADVMRLGVGGTLNLGITTANYLRLGQKLETNTSANYGGAALNTWSATSAERTIIDINRSKSATIGTQTIVASNDFIGEIAFRASDGVQFIQGAGIAAAIDGTPGTNDMPTRLMLYTTADGAAAVSERMRITNAGDVGIGKTPTTGIILDVGGQLGLKSYTVATLPSASVQAGAIVYASDAGGNGPCLVVSNGTNWKRCDNTSTTVS